ncbi:carboxylesterase family protein [Pseudooceanicola sp. CBS1P-1]|uniref:Carboxylesterase family protein n=1 Tax=Pseudooceanicola albus TaxID=2692189 RepID=A0A6L7G436_9RHOB|nr:MULTISPECIES: carboxylesterase family protein [Pseudooceanicola]MBT9384575.1 carboxylesterase family protein [Pseudooceanicola endophyticus]MXN18277.1 carboxylesterase family protein [Pseudooceanicola albus]
MTAPQARIRAGRIAGATGAGVERFLGIPYAAPPLGPLRWRAPQPVTRWDGLRAATAFGHDPMQEPFPSDAAPLGTPPAEDCLTLNVWRPEGTRPGDGLPVMVWIYGGGLVNGGASPAVYDGAALAAQGLVVVSFNYRVGRFGFFRHPALAEGAPPEEQAGNFGFLDQLAALEWVRDNIDALGGDPARVSVVGESAGGQSVHVLLTSPRARGLFRAAVIQSGSDGAQSWAGPDDRAGERFAESCGIAPGSGAAAALRALDAQAVTRGLNMTHLASPPGARDFCAPQADGGTTCAIRPAYEAGAFARVPVMIGYTSDDLGGPEGAIIRGTRELADLLAPQTPTWAYVFDYVAGAERDAQTRGARHATEIPFFFGTHAARLGADRVSEADRRASRTAMGYLVGFVKTGQPAGAALPPWSRHAPGQGFQVLTRDGGAAPEV